MTPEHEALVARIESSAVAVRRAVGDAPPHRFSLAPQPGEWSAMETLTHLCLVVVHVYGTRIRRMLYETAPVFVDFDEVSFRRASLARGDSQAGLLETVSGRLPHGDGAHGRGDRRRRVLKLPTLRVRRSAWDGPGSDGGPPPGRRGRQRHARLLA